MMLSPAKISESTWSVPVASLLLVGMLVAFYAVVSNAAKAGELRRHVTATQTTAVVSCHALNSRAATKSCIKQLDANLSADEPVLIAAR